MFLQKTLSGSFTVRNRHLQKLLAAKGMDRDDIWSSITLNKGSVQHLDFLTEQEKAVYRTGVRARPAVGDRACGRSHALHLPEPVGEPCSCRANVHKRDLHQIHMMAWKRGVKSLYYCRSLSIQRADNVSEKVVRPTALVDATLPLALANVAPAVAEPANYEECLACQ